MLKIECIKKKLDEANSKLDYGSVSKVLILHDYCDLFQNVRFEIRMVRQLYVSFYVFKSALIHWVNRNKEEFDMMWKKDSPMYNFHKNIATYVNLDNITLFDYDLIVCGREYEVDLYHRLVAEYAEFNDKREFPAMYAFSSHDDLETFFFEPFALLFRNRYILDDDQKANIQKFKGQIDESFVSYGREEQEKINSLLVERIVQINKKLENKEIKQILILDNQLRKFYLGDSCFWFKNIKENILSLTDNGTVTINCCNHKRFNAINSIFKNSFGDRINLTNTNWNEIEFNKYELVICHSESAGYFLHFLDLNFNSTFNQLFENTAIYFEEGYRSDMGTDLVQATNSNNLDIDVLLINLKQKNDANNPLGKLKGVKVFRSKLNYELVILEEERRWADSWLEQKGVKEDERVVILPDAASSKDKMLQTGVYIDLINWFISHDHIKVLLFDENKMGKKEKIGKLIDESRIDKLIVAEGLDIRKAMCILSSRYITAIIGPCTGILHLANGIYNYFINKKIVSKAEKPLMIVYTGRGMSKKYHPNIWWFNSLIKCIVVSKNEQGDVVLKHLKDCPKKLEEYQLNSLFVSEITTNMLINFIIANFNEFFKMELSGNSFLTKMTLRKNY